MLTSATFALGMTAAYVLVPFCRTIALRFGCVAQPGPSRRHQQATPYLGGLAIAATVVGGTVLVGSVGDQGVLFASAIFFLLIGLTDDCFSLKPSTTLVAEIALASALLVLGYRLDWVVSRTLDSFLTIVWIVGMANAFRLLDNLDGLCGGVALITGAAVFLGLPAATPGTPVLFEPRYLVLLLGAIAGFLAHNIHPASIVMGSSGSLFIGFSLAGLTFGSGREAGFSVLSIVAAPVLVLLVPILNTTVTKLRLKPPSEGLIGPGGEPSLLGAATGTRGHSSHRLIAIGLSERRTVAVLWAFAAMGGLGAWVVRSWDDSWSVPIVLTMLLGAVASAVYLTNVRRYDEVELGALSSRGGITPLVSTFMHKRGGVEVLLDFGLISIAYYVAYWIKFDDPQSFLLNFPYFLESFPVVVATQMVALLAAGAYRRAWPSFSLTDGVVCGIGVVLGAVASELIIPYLYSFKNYSWGVFVVYALLLMLFLTASRVSFSLIGEIEEIVSPFGPRLAARPDQTPVRRTQASP